MKSSKNPSHDTRGFALIVTLSLMILLVVIAVGLLTLSSISLRASSQGAALAVAQANARLALALAIGDLQRELGPDSRISAPNDAGSPTGGSKNWTAAYDAWESEDAGDPETPDSRGEPKFRKWLVSGADSGSTGTNQKVQLVGPGSLGGSANAALQVDVPMVQVKESNRSGRLAWWVSDEGTKAKINAGPNSIAQSSYGLSDSLFHSQSPPNPDHRIFPPLAAFNWQDGQRGNVISSATLPLATGVAGNALEPFAHDFTVHSAGVLADVRAGRLKRDLSNLLERPVTTLEDKPLYLADGRMNSLNITKNGDISNSSGIPAWKSGKNKSNQWGINLEELHLFHTLPRNLTWSGGKPSLTMKSTREASVADRYYMYKRPSTLALQFIYSLQAVPDTQAGKYKMIMKLDAMVAVGNPNDVPLVVPPGLDLEYQLSRVPYDLKWNIKKTAGGTITTTRPAPVLKLFKGNLEGKGSGKSAGFTLEPGEAAVFGSSIASNFDLDLRRGFDPSGGVEVKDWDLQARNLAPTDMVECSMQRISTEPTTDGYGWTQFNAWLGGRSGTKGWQADKMSMKGGSLSGSFVDGNLPPTINVSQARPVSDFVAKAQPIMMLSFLQNIEQSSPGATPDAFPSRPYQLSETPVNERLMNPSTMAEDLHAGQLLVTAEPMNYQFRTLAAGKDGRNIYVGGFRQPNNGGSFNVINRRIPLAPPLSIGAFHHAIASGFCGHFNDGGGSAVGNDPFPSSAVALAGKPFATPLVSHAIGNSYGVPQLAPDEVFSNSASGAMIDVATDQSWMINTALWDAWFLSGIVDGTGGPSSSWMTDSRTARDQFMDFAEGRKPLRNKRFIFHSSKAAKDVADELFSGSKFKDSAINLLPKYLLVDGSFNVNSTSEKAWAALLSSVRDQQLITASGSTSSFGHPFGTLGYAANEATTGTEGDWAGLRDLSDTEISSLASAIVTEVKARGPFLSMADFVNRRPDSSNSKHQAIGALQAAINLSGLNSSQATGNRAVSGADFNGLPGAALIDAEPSPSRAVGSRGLLTQGDLLTAIGSQITVRSDTFVIRCYGDARDASDKILARAWCEAVVQRVPEYVDPADDPEAQDGWPGTSDKLADVNARFGRRFEVRSFRWLSSEEI